MKLIKCGVPQGSILGPILFLIYINDLVNICKHTSPYLFADDTNLFINGKQLCELADKLNRELLDISIWLKVNKLSLNIKKTHFMVFTSKRKIPNPVSLFIDGIGIDEVKHTKFLGVFIDNRLTWKKHIDYISGKISRGIAVILKARKLLNERALITLYYSFVYPFFTYCNHVWGNACKTHLKRLVILQKRIVRIITSSPYLEHTDPLFYKLGLLKLSEINKYAFAKFMYRWYHRKLPRVFDNCFMSVRDIHPYNTRSSAKGLLYCTCKIRTCVGPTRFKYLCPHIWNDIIKAKINPSTSELVFSKSIKQCLKVGLI